MDRPTDLAAVALNITPFDFVGNRKKVEKTLDEIKAAFPQNRRPLVLFPERTFSGHCGSFHDALFVRTAAREQLDAVLAKTAGMIALFGLVNDDGSNRPILAADGEMIPIPADQPFHVGSLRAAIASKYAETAENAPFADADLILAPNARPFTFGSQAAFEEQIRTRTGQSSTIFAAADYAGNEAGSILYGGGAFVARAGKIVARTERFSYQEQAWTTYALEEESNAEPLEALRCGWESARGQELPFEEFARAVGIGLFDYLRKCRAGGLTLSLSGGADSAAIAVLIRLMVRYGTAALGVSGFCEKLAFLSKIAALGDNTKNVSPDKSPENTKQNSAEENSEKITQKSIVAALLTTVYQATSHSGEVTRRAAEEIALATGAVHYQFDIDPIVEAYKSMVSGAIGRPLRWETDDLALQNIQARTRAPGVWLLANLTGSLLLATGNRSEAAVGYATMDGDTCGCLSPIAGVSKAFLRKWLRWLETVGTRLDSTKNQPETRLLIPELACINAQQPTAELRPPAAGQTDEGDLMPYSILEIIERGFVVEKLDQGALADFVRVKASGLPERALLSDEKLLEWIEKFKTLYPRAEWKRRRFAPGFLLDPNVSTPPSPDDTDTFPLLSGKLF